MSIRLLIPGQDIYWESQETDWRTLDWPSPYALAQPRIAEQFIGESSRFAAVQEEEE